MPPLWFGQRPRVFPKLLKPVLSILRQRGIRLIAYLGYILLMAPSVDQVLQHAASTINLLEGLGFTVRELLKVHTGIFPANGVPRFPRKLNQPHPQPPQGQNKKDPVKLSGSLRNTNHHREKIVQIPVPLVFIHARCLSRSTSHSIRSTGKELCPRIPQILRGSSPSRLRVPPGGTVVERQPNSVQRESPTPAINRPGHRDRCLSQKLGAYCQGVSTGGRWLPLETSYPINCLELLVMSFTKNKARAQVLLLMDSNLHKQNGRDTLPHVVLPSQKPLGLVPHPQYPSVSSIHSRNAECRSKSGIQSISGLRRLETKSSGF